MSTRCSGCITRSASFLNIRDRKMPYIIGVAGSVAVGKSTTARVLQALLARWSPRPKVDLITTDGFLYPNAVLERQGIMQKKGFPESYDLPLLLSFLVRHQGRPPPCARAGLFASDLRHRAEPVGRDRPARHPDRRGRQRAADRQAAARRQGRARRLRLLRFLGLYRCRRGGAAQWYIRRFLSLRDTAFTDPKSYFNRYALLSDEEATATAIAIWERINLANLEDNILPTRPRATLILKKGADHMVAKRGAQAAVIAAVDGARSRARRVSFCCRPTKGIRL